MSPYSAIVFHQDIDESIISFIKIELNRGIKVYFFTYCDRQVIFYSFR